MNADAFRYLFGYHFAENRKVWDEYIAPLSDEQFTLETGYSHGSVRNQVVHLIRVDDAWFSELGAARMPEPVDPASLADRGSIRSHWDALEQRMRDYLDALRDDMLFERPFPAGEDENLIMWQVLLHVVNHGTDHRAQLLRLLNDLGVRTESQDLVFYLYEHP